MLEVLGQRSGPWNDTASCSTAGMRRDWLAADGEGQRLLDFVKRHLGIEFEEETNE